MSSRNKTAALHEAAHAVAAVRLGIRFDNVYILGREGKIEPGIYHREQWRTGRDLAVVSLAGPASEMIFMKRGAMYVVMRQRSDFKAATRQFDGDVWQEAFDLVKRNREQVVWVADALISHGCMLEAEVMAVMN